MIKAIEELWPYTGEMFITADYEKAFGIDSATLKNIWEEKVKIIFDAATLTTPEKIFMQTGGKTGQHGQPVRAASLLINCVVKPSENR